MTFAAALARINRTVVDTFGESTVVRAGYPSFRAVFDHRTADVDMMSEVSGVFSGPVPVLTVADSLIVGLGQGDGLMVDGVAYTVRDLQPDSGGMTRVTLRLA